MFINAILWNDNIWKEAEKWIYISLIEPVCLNGTLIWEIVLEKCIIGGDVWVFLEQNKIRNVCVNKGKGMTWGIDECNEENKLKW